MRWDTDRWRHHQARDYGEGKADEPGSDEPRPHEDRGSRWTVPIALVALVAFVVLAAWLIWAKENASLGVLLLIVGGGSALFVLGTARRDRRA